MTEDNQMDPAVEEAASSTEPQAEAAAQAPAAAPEPVIPPSKAALALNPVCYLQHRSEVSATGHAFGIIGTLAWALIAGGAAWSFFRQPMPLFLGAGLLLLAGVFVYAYGEVMTTPAEGAARADRVMRFATVAALAAFAGLFLALGLAAPARLSFKVVAFAGVMAALALLVLHYGLKLVFDWSNAKFGLWLLAGFVLLVLAFYLFVSFQVLPAGLAAIAGLVCMVYALFHGAMGYLPNLSRLLVAAGLLINIPLGIFLFREWGVEHENVVGFECLDSNPGRLMDASTGELRWGPAVDKDAEGGRNGASRVSFAYELKGSDATALGAYLHPVGESMHFEAGRNARGWSWSPDGQRLAFVNEGKGGKGELYAINFEKRVLQAAEPGGKSLGEVIMPRPEAVSRGDAALGRHGQVWSRDGRQLVFASPAKGDTQVWRADLGRKTMTQITSGGMHSDPAWSPDGREIMYLGRRNHTPRFQVAIAGGAWNDLDLAANKGLFPAWSADQKIVLFLKDGVLNRMNSNGTNQEQLVNSVPGTGNYISHDKRPVRFRYWEPVDTWHILARDVRTGAERQIYAAEANRVAEPLWSPDGKRIAFLMLAGSQRTVMTVQSDGQWPARILTTSDEIGPVRFSPRGDRLAFKVRRDNGEDELWMANADGTEPFAAHREAGRLGTFSWSTEGTYIAMEQHTAFWPVLRPLTRVALLNTSDMKVRQLMPYSLLSKSPAFSPNGTLLAFVGWSPRWLAKGTTALWVARIE